MGTGEVNGSNRPRSAQSTNGHNNTPARTANTGKAKSNQPVPVGKKPAAAKTPAKTPAKTQTKPAEPKDFWDRIKDYSSKTKQWLVKTTKQFINNTTSITLKPITTAIKTAEKATAKKQEEIKAYNEKKNQISISKNPKAPTLTIVKAHPKQKGSKTQTIIAKDDKGNEVKIEAKTSLSDENVCSIKSGDGRQIYINTSNPAQITCMDYEQKTEFLKKEAKHISKNITPKKAVTYTPVGGGGATSMTVIKMPDVKTLDENISHIDNSELRNLVNEELKNNNEFKQSCGPKVENPIEEMIIKTSSSRQETVNRIAAMKANGAYTDPLNGKQDSRTVGRLGARICHEAAKRAGTDEEGLKAGTTLITNPEEMKYANDYLISEGYEPKKERIKNTNGEISEMVVATPFENLLLSEDSMRNHNMTCDIIKGMMDRGAYGEAGSSEKIEAQTRNAYREIIFEVKGYTSTDDLKKALNILDDPTARKNVEGLLHNNKVDGELKPQDEDSYIRAYLRQDGWNNEEVDRFDAVLIKNNAYEPASYTLDENGKPDQKEQAHRNSVLNRLMFGQGFNIDNYDPKNMYNFSDLSKSEKESIRIALDAIGPGSADYDNLLRNAKVINQKQGYKPEFKHQDENLDAIQIFFANTFDSKGIDANNTILYKTGIPPRVEAESSLREIMKTGDYSRVFNSSDPEVYEQMSLMLSNGDLESINGAKNLEECYNKALSKFPDKNNATRHAIMANAVISGQIPFSNEQIREICTHLARDIRSYEGYQLLPLPGDGLEENKKCDDVLRLQTILSQNPQVAQGLKDEWKNNGLYNYVNGKYMNMTYFVNLINNIPAYSAKEPVFYDDKGNKITDPQRINEIIQENENALKGAKEQIAMLEREHKMFVDTEGWYSNAANGFSAYMNLGTDRNDVAREYRSAKAIYQNMELAARGLLRDGNGNVISLSDYIDQEASKISSGLKSTNSNYKTSQTASKIILGSLPAVATASAVNKLAPPGVTTKILYDGITAAIIATAPDAFDAYTSETGWTTEKKADITERGVKVAAVTFLTAGTARIFQDAKLAHQTEELISSKKIELSKLTKGTDKYAKLEQEIVKLQNSQNAFYERLANSNGYKAYRELVDNRIIGGSTIREQIYNTTSESVRNDFIEKAINNGEITEEDFIDIGKQFAKKNYKYYAKLAKQKRWFEAAETFAEMEANPSTLL